MPNKTIHELQKSIQLWDKFTLDLIIDYLKLDTFEIVKKLATITNSTNASETIAYRDGALSRNEALMKFCMNGKLWIVKRTRME